MNDQGAIAIWVTRSAMLADAVFTRQYPVWSHLQGSILTESWKAQLLYEKAKQQGMEPDFHQLRNVPLHQYHVRKSRLLLEDVSLKSQGVNDGDVFVSLVGDAASEGVMEFIRDTQAFPSKISGKQYQHRESVAVEDLAQGRDNVTTILFVAADPSDATRLRLGEEVRDIQGELQSAELPPFVVPGSMLVRMPLQ